MTNAYQPSGALLAQLTASSLLREPQLAEDKAHPNNSIDCRHPDDLCVAADPGSAWVVQISFSLVPVTEGKYRRDVLAVPTNDPVGAAPTCVFLNGCILDSDVRLDSMASRKEEVLRAMQGLTASPKRNARGFFSFHRSEAKRSMRQLMVSMTEPEGRSTRNRLNVSWKELLRRVVELGGRATGIELGNAHTKTSYTQSLTYNSKVVCLLGDNYPQPSIFRDQPLPRLETKGTDKCILPSLEVNREQKAGVCKEAVPRSKEKIDLVEAYTPSVFHSLYVGHSGETALQRKGFEQLIEELHREAGAVNSTGSEKIWNPGLASDQATILRPSGIRFH